MTSLSLLAGRRVERLKKVNAKAFCQILTKSATSIIPNDWGAGVWGGLGSMTIYFQGAGEHW